jgi:ketosteroid isomerase-like protein
MSQENVDIVLGLVPAPDLDIAALVRDEPEALSAVIGPALSPDFDCVARGMPSEDEKRYEGTDGLRALWLDWLAPWATYRTEIEDAIEVGEHVVLLIRDFARSHESPSEVMLHGASVWTVRAGKIARIDFYPSRGEALKAVGLEE